MSTKHNIVIEQGSTFSIEFSLEHSNGMLFDASEYYANASIKKQYESSSNTALIFSSDIANNIVTISLFPADTINLPYGRYYYDVLITKQDNTDSIRIVEGIADIKPQISSRDYSDG